MYATSPQVQNRQIRTKIVESRVFPGLVCYQSFQPSSQSVVCYPRVVAIISFVSVNLQLLLFFCYSQQCGYTNLLSCHNWKIPSVLCLDFFLPSTLSLSASKDTLSNCGWKRNHSPPYIFAKPSLFYSALKNKSNGTKSWGFKRLSVAGGEAKQFSGQVLVYYHLPGIHVFFCQNCYFSSNATIPQSSKHINFLKTFL